ncbi:MobA/MobL family protein [Microvirga sp. BT688]|uniref:MobA/MobL family protein n=1 Tax=Microvirga sp. TaxID=1873136 RepID=UPI001689388B|nr:MobA/MobL family protein [Microvirga sp.]MBD2745864.1 MobA/MobL family protein [Microvirga sp.]
MTEEEAQDIVRRDLARSLAMSSRIAEAERRAKERLKRRSSSSKNLAALVEAFSTPGLRSARDFNASMAFKVASRPKAPDTGGVTFHFSVTSVSKTNHTVAAYAGRAPSGSAAQHESYIEREGAAETFVDPESARFAGSHHAQGAHAAQTYIERDAASEKHEEENAIVISSFGNIGDTRDDRLSFWQKLEQAERSPKDHRFIINPFRGSEFWAAIERHAKAGHEVPKPLANAIKHSMGEVSPYEIQLKDEEAIAVLKFAHSMGDFQTDGAIKVSLGRGGRVQTRIIAELPHEITAAQRLQLAKQYCKEFERQGLPYWAVIHAPDQHNDSRNYHIHIALSERPAKKIQDEANGSWKWDFEIVETFKSQSRNMRTRRPFMQERVREMNSLAWIGSERRRFCNTLNKVLEQSGSRKRYDHRSYKAMGLTQKAKKRIDPKIYAKERKGQVTEQGIEAARQQWEAAAADTQRQATKAARDMVEASYKNRFFLTRLFSEEHPDTGAFQTAMRKAADLHALVISGTAAQFAANFVADKMVSRARLKDPKKRTKVDRILIEVAAEIRAVEVKQLKAVTDRFGAECREQAVKIAKIQSDYVKQFQKLMFDQMLGSIAPLQSAAQRARKAAPRMTMQDIEAMAAKLFPKRSSLSDPLPEAPKKVEETSAIDRYLGKNFFNPKNVGKKPVRTPKAPAPPSRQSSPAAPSQQAPAPAPPAAAQKPAEIQARPSDPTLQSTEERSPAERPATSVDKPRTPSPATIERAIGESPGTLATTKTKVTPAPTVDEVKKPAVQTAPPVTPADAMTDLKKRKKRKPEAIEQAPAEKQPVPDREARRRAIIAQRNRNRGKGR